MGNYNPHAPRIIGQEWVPIRNENTTLTPAQNLIEVGHGFSLTATRVVRDGRFYINAPPAGDPNNQVMMMGIYPAGHEEHTGPVRSVIIPVNSALITGVTPVPLASSVSDVLLDPADGKYLLGTAISNNDITIDMKFAVSQYIQLLVNKRILGVDFLYSMTAQNGIVGDTTPFPEMFVSAGTSFPSATVVDMGVMEYAVGNQVDLTRIGRTRMGEIDWFWQNQSAVREMMPWTPTRLQAFDSGQPTSRKVRVSTGLTNWGVNQTFQMYYGALEVFFCDEQRVAVGGAAFIAGVNTQFIQNTNTIPLRTLDDAANPSLSAGNYTTYVSTANQGDQVDLFAGEGVVPPTNSSLAPTLNSIRELYAIPPHPGLRVKLPSPMGPSVLGQTFTKEDTHILPQLSLHTSAGPLTEVHVYGRQAVAQVYGTVTATQEIQDGLAGGSASWPWVRYVARRFGDTIVPLTLTGAGQSVSITPTEFDALDEILDGWKEITLRFTTPPTMGTGTQPQFVWSSTGEEAGNRWEVLGAMAPALSGTPGNLLTLTPSPHQLSIATYGQPVSGASINLGWVPQYAPYVSATVDDQTSDAFIIFAQDMPTVTGFSVTTLNMALSGIGQECGLDPCCVPTALQYNRLSWPYQQEFAIQDTFSRLAASGWGSAESGQLWNLSGGILADYSVNGSQGLHTRTISTNMYSTVSPNWYDSDVTVKVSYSSFAASPNIMVTSRFIDSSNHYRFRVGTNTSGLVSLRLIAFIAGSSNFLSPGVATGITLATSQFLWIRAQTIGPTLKMKVWVDGTEEPDTWMVTAADPTFTSGQTGVLSESGLGWTATFDDFSATNPSFGHYELQRMDTVETDWQTIMSATSPLVTGFNDYEARVGILSSYRIREVDPYDFYGLWSDTVTATIPAPGVTIGCDDGHLLIFTSNEVQDGSINLAYSSVWESRQVEEGFAFPESSFVQLQAMYNRDYFTAFRPIERGGEQFQRTVLVQAAAIAPETLADFTGLRDMAWADVPYICVRDEDGNRWFATVLVPSGRVLRDRRLYMAPVNIIEVTATPSPVDP